jgi:hypothetical protein
MEVSGLEDPDPELLLAAARKASHTRSVASIAKGYALFSRGGGGGILEAFSAINWTFSIEDFRR